jgi:hypothetical protein
MLLAYKLLLLPSSLMRPTGVNIVGRLFLKKTLRKMEKNGKVVPFFSLKI